VILHFSFIILFLFLISISCSLLCDSDTKIFIVVKFASHVVRCSFPKLSENYVDVERSISQLMFCNDKILWIHNLALHLVMVTNATC